MSELLLFILTFGFITILFATIAMVVLYIYAEENSKCVHCIYCKDFEEYRDGGGYYECKKNGVVKAMRRCYRFERITPFNRSLSNENSN